jgi:DNA-directed RNA polymerase subunit F
MAKPIILITRNESDRDMAELRQMLAASPISEEYHILVVWGEEMNFQVFFEKDQSELTREMLEKLLDIAKRADPIP